MEFRRSSHSDERRRRVLIEETGSRLAETASAPRRDEVAGGLAAEPVRTYAEAALPPSQRRVVDLIPKRRWTVLVLALLALCFVAGLEAIYGHVALAYTPLRIEQVPAVDLGAPGNVGSCFSSCLLLAAAGQGVLIYLIRRHRADDYRGRYRMWYWMVPLLVLASLDQVSDLQTSARMALLVVAGIPDYADAAWIWSVAWGCIATLVVIRLAVEMRACRVAVVGLGGAWICHGVQQAAAWNWMLEVSGVCRVMTLDGLAMCGNVCLFLTLCLYARHVLRDACGEVPSQATARPKARARRQPRAEKAAVRPAAAEVPATAPSAASSKAATIRVDQPHTATAPLAKPTAPHSPADTPRAVPKRGGLTSVAARTEVAKAEVARASIAKADVARAEIAQRPAADDTADDLDADDDAGDSKLSKAERRRLRKLRRRDHHES